MKTIFFGQLQTRFVDRLYLGSNIKKLFERLGNKIFPVMPQSQFNFSRSYQKRLSKTLWRNRFPLLLPPPFFFGSLHRLYPYLQRLLLPHVSSLQCWWSRLCLYHDTPLVPLPEISSLPFSSHRYPPLYSLGSLRGICEWLLLFWSSVSPAPTITVMPSNQRHHRRSSPPQMTASTPFLCRFSLSTFPFFFIRIIEQNWSRYRFFVSLLLHQNSKFLLSSLHHGVLHRNL